MIEVTVSAPENMTVHISEWDEGGAWFRLGSRNGSIYAPVSRSQAQELMECLQAILAKEVTA